MPLARRQFLTLAMLLLLAAPAAADPVTEFIMRADSLATAGGDDALGAYVSERAIIVGAAVGQLLDVAFQVGMEGNADGEKENVEFARRVALLHETRNGSRIPLTIVETYRRWNAAERRARADALQLEEDAKAARADGDLEKCVELHNRARAAFEKIGDQRSIAVNWGSLGVANWYRGDFDAVIESYQKALAARRAVEDRILEGRTLNGLGSAHRQKGEYEQAIDYYRQAIDLRRRTHDWAGLGTSLTYLGNVYYITGQLVDARDQYEAALPILEAQGNPDQMVDMLNSIGGMYSDMGRRGAANDAFRRAIDLAQDNRLNSKEITCRLNLADNLRVAGQYSDALAEFQQVEELLADNDAPEGRAQLLRDRGRTYMATGDLDRAREDLVAALKAAEAVEEPRYLLNAHLNVGLLYWHLGAYERGRKAGLEAKRLAEENGLAREYRDANMLLGDMERALGNHEAALAYYNEGQAQDEYDGMTLLAAADEINVATSLADLGRLSEARERFHQVSGKLAASGGEAWSWTVHMGLGHTFEDENPDSAAYHYGRALDMLDASRESLGGAQATAFLSGNARFFYEEIARYYARLAGERGGDWSNKAFETVERAKARGLLESVTASVATETSPEEEQLLDKLYRLDTSTEEGRREARRLRDEVEALRDKRRREALGRLAATPVIASLDDARGAISKNTVMLAYALGDSASLMWAIDRDGYQLFELPARDVITERVTQLRDAIRQPGAGDAALAETAYQLYQDLVAPAGERVEGAEHLIVVPDGVLYQLPFEVLTRSRHDPSEKWKDADMVAREYSTVYAPSVSVYVQLHGVKRGGKPDLDLLAFGAPDYTALVHPLDPLPFAAREVKLIGEEVKEKRRDVLLGADATEANYKLRVNATAPRVLHLAAHGLIDPVEPAASSIALGAGNGEDGYLHTLEIVANPSNAALVVMSACESALGRVSRGEGVLGLQRAFLASGADGVVASLWSVSDESTALLMQHFYDRLLGKKKPAGEALAYAQRKLLDDERFDHPFYWAAFVVTGTDRAPW